MVAPQNAHTRAVRVLEMPCYCCFMLVMYVLLERPNEAK